MDEKSRQEAFILRLVYDRKKNNSPIACWRHKVFPFAPSNMESQCPVEGSYEWFHVNLLSKMHHQIYDVQR